MIDYRGYSLTENVERIRFALDGAEQDSPFDEGQPRGFMGSLVSKCDCCAYVAIHQDIRDGVVRFLARKSSSFVQGKLDTYPCTIYAYDLPSRPGVVPKLVAHAVKVPVMRGGRLFFF